MLQPVVSTISSADELLEGKSKTEREGMMTLMMRGAAGAGGVITANGPLDQWPNCKPN